MSTPLEMNAPRLPNHPTLVIVRGVPGSGKSYLTASLRKLLGETNVITLDPDGIDYKNQGYINLSKSLTEEGVDTRFHPYRFLRSNAYKGIDSHKIIIWNQGFTNLDGLKKTVVNLQAYAAQHDTSLPLLVVEVEVDTATAKKRVTERYAQGGHGVTRDAFERFTRDYRSFANEGFSTVTIDGSADIATSASKVLHALTTLWKQQ